MPLPSSGSISMNQVNVELGRSGTTAISLNESAVRGLAGVASGTISLYNFYGKSAGLFATVSDISFSSGGYTDSNFGTGGLAIDASENIHIVGTTSQTYIFVAKISKTGSILWQRTLAVGQGNSRGTGCDLDSAGNLYVSGRYYTSWVLAKYNSSGTLLWQYYYNTVYTGGAQGVAVVLDQPWWSGTSGSEDYGGNDAVLIRTNTGDGSRQEGNGNGGFNNENAGKLSKDSNYNLYQTYNEFYSQQGLFFSRYSVSPLTLGATKTHERGFRNVYGASAHGNASYTYLVGQTTSSPGRAFIAQMAVNSYYPTINWKKDIFSTAYECKFMTVKVASDGSVYVGGAANSRGLLVKMNSSGAIVWQRFIGPASGSYVNEIHIVGSKIYGIGAVNGVAFIFSMSTDGATGTFGSYSITAGDLSIGDNTTAQDLNNSGYSYMSAYPSSIGLGTGTPTNTVTVL